MQQTYTLEEMMAAAAAMEFEDREIAFVGIGIPLLAGILAKRSHAPNLTIVYESGCIGPEKYRVDFNVGDSSAADSALCLTSEWRVFGDLQLGCYDVGVIGAAQIDRFGNLNTTCILGKGDYYAPEVRLPGSGGANDIGSSVNRTIIMMRLERQRFVEKVDYITTPGYLDGSPGARARAGLTGNGPAAVITNRAVFRFDPLTGEMFLEKVYPNVSVEEIKASVGWPLKLADKIEIAQGPTAEQLAILRAVDPVRMILEGSRARKKIAGIDQYVELTLKHLPKGRP